MSTSSRGSSPRALRDMEKESFLDLPFDPSSAVIHELAWDDEPDTMSLAPWRRAAMRLLIITASIPTLIGLYVARIQVDGLVEYSMRRVLSRTKMSLAWSIIGSDLLLAIPAILTTVLLANTISGTWRRRIRLLGDNVPTVDVIITACREPLAVVQDTVLAALAIDYPNHRFRVIVSDDGADARLRSWTEETARARVSSSAKSKPGLYYTARQKTGPAGYKAGNLNHAIHLAESLPGGPAEFVAGLDADMIPTKHWLRAIAGHMVADPRLCVACPPQHFYNFPENDPLNQSLWVAWRCRDVARDMCGLAWNSGSGWMVRRRALRDIGGFPRECLVEDVSSAILMLARGWRSAYVPEAVQYGLMPETYVAHLKQYARWNVGHCQLALLMGFYLSSKRTKYLSPHQRLSGFLTGFIAFAGPLLQMVQLFATFAGLLAGVPFLYAGNDERLRLLLRLQCGMILATWIHKLHLSILTGYQMHVRQPGEVDYMSPYYALSIIRSFLLPVHWGGKLTTFVATGSLSNSLHERDACLRAPLHRRLHHLIFHAGGLFHLAVVLLLPAAAAYRAYVITQMADTPRDLWIELLTRVGWPHAHWFVTVLVYLTPFWYMLFPPMVANREELLGRRDADGARYPTKEARVARWSLWKEGVTYWGAHGVLIYTGVVAWASGWI